MFLSVLDRVHLDRREEKPTPGGDPLSSVPADVAAARARRVNVEEFLWVKERVLEAEAANMTVRLNAAALAMLEKTLSDLKARRADAADEGSRKLLAEQTAQFEAEAERVRRESKVRETDAVRTNMKTLEPYRARLAAAQDALEKPLLKEAEKEEHGRFLEWSNTEKAAAGDGSRVDVEPSSWLTFEESEFSAPA